jgi:hypothetical protein
MPNVAIDSLQYRLTQEQASLAGFQTVVNESVALLATANANLAACQSNIAQLQAAIATLTPVVQAAAPTA